MPLLDALKRVTGRFSGARDDVQIIINVKQLYADSALAAPQNDESLMFLRRLNAARTVQELWALRSEHFTLVARSRGELEAMRQTEVLMGYFKPLLQIRHIRPGETQRLSTSFGQSVFGEQADTDKK
jgi:hypothetical protein